MVTQTLEKEFRRTELGILPEDWTIKKLEQVSTEIGDGIHATPQYIRYSEINFINGNNLVNSSIEINSNTKCVSEEEYKKYKKRLGSQTILMSINGTIGNLAYFKNEKVVLGKSAAYINLDNSVSKKYIFYLLQTAGIKKFYENKLTGTTIRNLSLESLRNTPISFPPNKEEQTAIAEVLSDTDDLIESLAKLIKKKKLIKQAAMQELLTGKKRLPGFNEKWEVKKLKEIAEIYNGGTPETSNKEYWDGTIFWCTPTDITGTKGKYLYETERKITNKGLDNSSARLLPKGSLLLCSRATIGEVKISRVSISTNQGFKSLVCFDEIDNEFVYYKLLTIKNKLVEKAIGTTFLEIAKKDTENTTICIPTAKKEQSAIAQILSDMDLEIEALQQERDKCKQLKAGLMQQLLTGRIRLKWKS